MRESKIQYNPSLTVRENARKNCVTEAAIRYYIKTNLLDRNFDRKQNIIADCRKYLKKHPKATRDELQKKTGHSLSTIRKYWQYISTEKELTDFDSEKTKKRLLRQSNNFYATHPSVTQDILREESFNRCILEPFCGSGTMAKVIEENGYEVKAYDIIDRGYGEIADFFNTDFPKGEFDIISNPPYDDKLCEVVARCLSICKDKVALLFPLRYLSGKARYDGIFKKYPPKYVYAYSDRIGIAKNADFERYSSSGSNPEIYAWYIWEKGFKGETVLRWIQNLSKAPKVRYDTVTILDGVEFHPYEEFSIPVGECIQFHSRALPENRVLSNHFDCIITFRDVEFYSLEQLFMGLTYSERPDILRRVLKAKSGLAAKKICREDYPDDRDWDFHEKQYRIIALCHLYKYLSVKEYRDRLRETYPQTLVECPNGKDYEFGLVQNLETNLFEGNNCSGRTTMLVRDTMLSLENKAISEKEKALGRILSPNEREEVVIEVCNEVRQKYDNNPQVIQDSKRLFDFISSEKIPVKKPRHPKPFVMPEIDRDSKGLILDFDNTLFDTSISTPLRQASHKDWDAIYKLIPKFSLYDGWKEVFEWAKENKVKIGIISSASGELIRRTVAYFKLPIQTIIGWQQFIEKPNPILGNMAMEKMGIRENQILLVGNSAQDEIQARCSKLRFAAATWDTEEMDYFTKRNSKLLKKPQEIIELLKDIQI